MAFKQLDNFVSQLLSKRASTNILMFRHGETSGNKTGQLAGWTNQQLTPRGRQQANSLYQSLHSHLDSFMGIHTSDLSRARDTCRIAVGFREHGISVDKRLREIHFGDLEGTHFSSLEKRMQKELNNRGYQAPNGESWSYVMERMNMYFSENCSKDGTHLVFSHGGLISTILYDLGLRDMVITNCSAIAFNIDPASGVPKELLWQWQYPQSDELTI